MNADRDVDKIMRTIVVFSMMEADVKDLSRNRQYINSHPGEKSRG